MISSPTASRLSRGQALQNPRELQSGGAEALAIVDRLRPAHGHTERREEGDEAVELALGGLDHDLRIAKAATSPCARRAAAAGMLQVTVR